MDSIKNGFCYWLELITGKGFFSRFGPRTNYLYSTHLCRRRFYMELNRGATNTARPPWKVLEDIKYMYGRFPRWDGEQWVEEDFGDD